MRETAVIADGWLEFINLMGKEETVVYLVETNVYNETSLREITQL